MSASPESAIPSNTAAAPVKPPMKRRWLLLILALTFLFVLMPFLFWQATWFGRPLDDGQIQKALVDTEHPREIQHALSQVADRMMAPQPSMRDSARSFYPEVIRVSKTGGDELRLTEAWVMGQDNSMPEFHARLSSLLGDSNPMVRRNAALALVRFGDASGIDEIRSMLRPYSVAASQAGILNERLKPGDAINPGTLLAHIASGGASAEARSQVPGSINRWLVPDGATVAAGQPVLTVNPSDVEVWEALRALYLVGQPQDLSAVQPLAQAGDAVPRNIRDQAELTARAIQTREKPKP
jgi:hypothetical protein